MHVGSGGDAGWLYVERTFHDKGWLDERLVFPLFVMQSTPMSVCSVSSLDTLCFSTKRAFLTVSDHEYSLGKFYINQVANHDKTKILLVQEESLQEPREKLSVITATQDLSRMSYSKGDRVRVIFNVMGSLFWALRALSNYMNSARFCMLNWTMAMNGFSSIEKYFQMIEAGLMLTMWN